ncbi:hypothetical protein D3C73_1328480 [compost metagenome]
MTSLFMPKVCFRVSTVAVSSSLPDGKSPNMNAPKTLDISIVSSFEITPSLTIMPL